MTKPIPDWAVPALRLWMRESSTGDKYLAGKWGAARVFIFRNPERHRSTAYADYILCFAKPNIDLDDDGLLKPGD